MELSYCVQNYAWGKIGYDSLVIQLKKNSDPDFDANDKVPYAELWLGVHPNGPSYIKSSNITLDEVMKQNMEKTFTCGKDIFYGKFPFLLKILSIKIPLSIQVHPSKSQAEVLHKNFPKIYKDPNHKPEMVIALTKFEALVGFRVVEEINNFLSVLPELQHVIGSDHVERLRNVKGTEELRACFTGLMLASKTLVEEQLHILIKRLAISDSSLRKKAMFDKLCQLHAHFPGDVGCFCLYFLNYIALNPGESLFVSHGEPHSYIYGDCVECMANSDNVVRAGFTPKLIDVNTLLEVLVYAYKTKEQIHVNSELIDKHAVLYRPPVDEFAVLRIKFQPHESYLLPPRNSISVFICISGSGHFNNQTFIKGQAFFMWANETIVIRADEETLIFQAFANIN